MDFTSFLVLLTIILVVSLALPMISSIGVFGVAKKDDAKTSKQKRRLDFNLKTSSGSEDSRGTSSNLAMKLEVDSKTGLKRRVIGEYNKDPNSFDFDIDELIEEERNDELKIERERIEKLRAQGQDTYEAIV